jgi:hypothetical protein
MGTVPQEISVLFSLCEGTSPDFVINPLIEGAKGLNATTEIEYGKADGAGGVTDVRTIANMCSDDPETDPEVEPSGIKLSAGDIAAITTACDGKI